MSVKQYTHPCRLTSPHEVSNRVRDIQWLLQGNNRFKGLAPYKDGEMDNEYGPLTAQAVRSAKKWLGYPASGQTNQFGQTVYEYLRKDDWRPLPTAFRERRDDLLKQHLSLQTPGIKAFKFALNERGYKETPVNKTKYGQWYGFNGVAWCDIFVTYCLHHSGWTKRKWSYVGNNMADAQAGRCGTFIVRSPRRGDLVLYKPNRHIAFFDKWTDQANGLFQDLGGNTSDGIGWSNGGEVAFTQRRKSEVQAFVRIG
jgi:hypothetical protein